MSLAADISNFTGVPTDATLSILRGWDINRFMVGTQNIDIAVNQARQLFQFGSFATDLYCQYDANKDQFEQFAQAKSISSAAFTTGRLWIAVEQIAILWAGGITEYVKRLDHAIIVARGYGFSDVGIYTSKNEWAKLTGGSVGYQNLPLWYANHDLVQSLTASIWQNHGFGGWWKPEWKQYQQNYTVNGQIVDFSVSS